MRTLAEALGIRKKGYRVILACQKGSYLEKFACEQALEVFPFDMKKFFSSLVNLSLFLKREKVDLINAHGYRDHFLCVLAGRIAGVKVIVRTKHNHVPLKSGFFSRFIYGHLTDRIVAISEHIREVMLQSGLQPEHVTTIHTAVNIKQISPTPKNHKLVKEFNLLPGKPVIGTVARLSDRKGIDFLLDAVKILADDGKHFTCLIVGGGGSKTQSKIDLLKHKAEALNISQHLVFTGWRSDIPEILSLFDIFILPSLAEGLGRSMLESMAAGKPVVASNVGGIPEAVEDGKTGILVPPQDYHALAKAISFLLDNPEKTEVMGRAGRERAKKMFSEEGMIENICSLYEELLKRG